MYVNMCEPCRTLGLVDLSAACQYVCMESELRFGAYRVLPQRDSWEWRSTASSLPPVAMTASPTYHEASHWSRSKYESGLRGSTVLPLYGKDNLRT